TRRSGGASASGRARAHGARKEAVTSCVRGGRPERAGGGPTLRGGAAPVNASGSGYAPRAMLACVPLRPTMRLALLLVAAATALAAALPAPAARAASPAVARARYRAESVQRAGGTVFFLELADRVVAVGSAHNF